MVDVLIKAGCFVAIILIGYTLRRVGFFKEGDFQVLSKIVLKITLPAAIVSSVANKEISPSLLFISLLGLAGGILYILIMCLLNARNSREQMAFDVVNTPGYNIGNFTLPFVQSFLGPVGVLTVSLFDVGNAMVCLGGSYSIASIIKSGGKFDVRKIANKLVRSVPFDTYVIMLILGLLQVKLPAFVTTFAGTISGGNAFLAMLMIGVGFNLSGDRSQIKHIAKIIAVRYGVAIVLALVFFNLLPIELEYRQALALLVFSPIGSAAPAFTAELKGDIGLASAINSVSIIISVVCIVVTLALVL
ncbi:MAG: AEC family transporter [Lachnospiraceae bacterium]|nr:AEC family transporter [Lachnospiraceae bacterium]